MDKLFCVNCGATMELMQTHCAQCGWQVPRAAAPMDEPAMKYVLPIGRSVWAIAAGYLALFSVLIFPAPFALVCGIIAVWDIKTHPGRLGMGRAVFGIVMGGLGTFILFLSCVLLTIGWTTMD